MNQVQDTATAFPNETIHDDRVERVEILISNLLRVGVGISLALVVVGTILSFVHHPEYAKNAGDLQHLTHPPSGAQPLHDMVSGLRQGQGQAVVMLGLILLIATPVVRVAVSVMAFVYQHDRVFVGITSLVLFLLLLSFFLGKVEG